jgi:hypothetical protein
MQLKTIWQQHSKDPDNLNNLAAIAQWWMNLNGKEIAWCQRLLSLGQELDTVNWEPQRFDEIFTISNPQIRGITLFWVKPGSPPERNTTADKLVLDNLHQQIYIYPKSQPGIVYRVGVPEVKYQIIELQNPQIEVTPIAEKYLLTLTDSQQKIIVKSLLGAAEIEKLQDK